jgi:RNA polymerase sigma-70 factor, ECF subfamily
MNSATESSAVAAAAKAGDESAFTSLVEKYRRELHVHCYRMLGSFQDSEDLVQETLLRAWRKRSTFQGRSTFRAWLYGIATNACFDALEARERRPRPVDATAPDSGGAELHAGEVPWLQPYPDRLLDAAAASDVEPDVAIVAKETIELAFLVAIQLLPPRQRAVLILRDVLGWPAKETAALLETSVASANSALQRARATLKKHLPARRSEWAPASDPSEEERALLRRYIDASERGDADAFLEMMREDARFAMPPEPGLYVGAETIVEGWKQGGLGSEEFGELRCLLTSANRQPAVANYLRRPGESEYRALALDVLRIEDGLITEIIAFPLFEPASFDLPSTL